MHDRGLFVKYMASMLRIYTHAGSTKIITKVTYKNIKDDSSQMMGYLDNEVLFSSLTLLVVFGLLDFSILRRG